MSGCLECLGLRPSPEDDPERQPLLPRYNDETALQTRLHEKLHTYQMLRALSKGDMPTNKQTTTHLRTLLSADVLNPRQENLSPSGRALVRTIRLWLTQFIELLQHKNSEDQIQDFIWYLTKARVDVDVADIQARASRAKVKADVTATYRSLQTVGSLLLNNSDFRVFLSDLSTVGKEVLKDTAFTLADVSKQAGEAIEPDQKDKDALKGANGSSEPVSKQDLKDEVAKVSEVLTEGVGDLVDEAGQSVTDHLGEEERETLVKRLKQTVLNLRQHTDYSESVSTISRLINRYLLAYSHAATEAAQAVEEDAHTNKDADRALHNFWLFVTSLGKKEHWKRVEESFNKVVEDGQADPNFDELVRQIGNLVQDMLMDPDFFENADERFKKLRAKSNDLAEKSSVRDDLDALLDSLHAALRSVLEDADIHKLINHTMRIIDLLSPAGKNANKELISDSINIFLPMLLQAIQFIPIPRVEVVTPAIDLLLENLILEPGTTINHTSFLPYKLRVSTYNDIEVRKGRRGTASTLTSLVNIKVSGLSLAAEDLGYWFRVHSGLLRFIDKGLAGFYLDERGIDISLDVEIGRESLEQIVTLRGVGVHIHHLNYHLTKSKFACLAWFFKPFIRPIVKKALEVKIATAIADGLHHLNRELLFARERLRAARIANPSDLWTFVRAVLARLVPAKDPDVEARVGVLPADKGVFRGRYAPGSLVRLWEMEAREAEQRVYEYERAGWKNDIFDVRTRPV
ncbi:hypothetical protein B0T10DRAFT_483712 [Thelonectria olida]|uniref:HAM1-like N-terminal domain-containing protein n=1 Tax=Thelonectria olida TaxID=1576542 RepID=A0A9P9AUA0_9HYPO|nr:hypothetical protein B0T10DRAFT_483712 [Thelonectria olida]